MQKAGLPIAKAHGGVRRARPGRPPQQKASPNLRDRILDVAEKQFALHGYDAVSTRGVAREVGATAAMIHYYFETKRKMFDAVFARRAEVVNRERMDALNAYDASAGTNLSAEGAIAAFLHPVLNKLGSGDDGWRHYLALVAQVGNIHEWGGAVMTQSFDPVVQRLISLVGKALPDARKEDLYWGYHFLSGALLLTLSETDRIDRLSGGRCRSDDIEAIEPRLVEFAAAGFQRVCQRRMSGTKRDRGRKKMGNGQARPTGATTK
jgi:AcrR family transcriptional regulator